MENIKQKLNELIEKLKTKKVLPIIIIVIIIAIIGTIIFLIVSGRTNLQSGFARCKQGNRISLKNQTIDALGIEDYQSSQFSGNVCHLEYAKDNFLADFYLDEKALMKFGGSRDKDAGNGCIVLSLGGQGAKTEFCFGEKVKVSDEEKSVKPSDEFLRELSQIAFSLNFAGTEWRYTIQIGGGIGGVMTFEKDDNGSLSGTFTEFGLEGKKEKSFVGSREKDNFLLTLEEFPTFKIILSADGKTMTGKPVEEVKDIFYPDDFFQANRE